MTGNRGTPEERFWARVDKCPDSGCWVWVGRRVSGGYGELAVFGKQTRAHRFSYELLVGPIPDGLQIDHLCRNRGCVNPDHLEPVTRKENILRGESPAAKRSRQTHCQYGHEFTPENTWTNPKSGHRRCRACGAIQAREVRRQERERRSTEPPREDRRLIRKTHCKHGHAFTPENTYIKPCDGSQVCLTCKRARARQDYARKQAR